MSNTNSFRTVGAGTTFLSPTDFLVKVDTSQGAVILVMPNIKNILDSYTSLFQYMGIRFVDVSDNASSNTITIIPSQGDSINDTDSIQISVNGAGGFLTIIGENKWSYVSTTNSNGNSNGYLFQQIPYETGYPSYTQEGDVIGYVKENGYLYNPPFIRLSNGNIAYIEFCITVLGGEIFIFSAFDVESIEENSFYWIAMRKSSTNPNKLEYITDLIFTQQFYDYGYLDIVNESNPLNLSCTFITYTTPRTGNEPIETYKTVLTYSNEVLSAVDSIYDFGGETFISLWNNLTGAGVESIRASISTPLHTANSFGSEIMNPQGEYSGYIYYWDNNDPDIYTNIVGYNIITGETRLVQPFIGLSNVTNWAGTPNTSIVNILSHPKGIFFILDDGQIPDNFENYTGVTSFWSPDITNNTLVKYINNRNEEGEYASTNGSINDNTTSGIYFYFNADSEYFYLGDTPIESGECVNLILYRFKLDYENEGDFDISNLPLNNQVNQIIGCFVYATNNGSIIFSYADNTVTEYSPLVHPVFWANDKINPVQLQINCTYTTNFYGNTIYDTSGETKMTNWLSYGITYDKYNLKIN